MDYMEQALSLAKLALGQVSPNPAVGAAVVRDGVVVGQGYTQMPGYNHAEIVALEQAGEAARGSKMYITLEPCCHHGRTPPCSQAIISAGVNEVHMAMLDPNPLVSGKGREELGEAGIKTFVGEHMKEAENINEAYTKFITTGLPFITAKFAMSLDGKIATRSGDSRWISSPEARQYVHSLRSRSDAIMVGADTIINDNPQLTTRCCGGKGGAIKKQPLRVIVDGKGRTPLTARVFNEPGETLVLLGRKATKNEKEDYTRAGFGLLELPSEEGHIELKRLMKALGEKQITSVMVEGGSGLFGSLFDQGLVDKVIVFIAPIIIGGETARTAVGGTGAARVIDSLKINSINEERFGQDIMITGYVGGRECSPEL
ncbi:MAG TPA: bifunctional diaminohydroxyphosphoribosylaminopyrimidine deaminase/5-amino-6-(5-phosphoribosylamino)uracil reductase RibD [Dehalococcoidia bacterium]|nr:bifunctional diaminohydroxyphosphoribosylaminopyrimidine deaminase/5-amino-6-(5-phosphoribosylamino)uracil reductase RibD [Dehalococcoidia bacterium]